MAFDYLNEAFKRLEILDEEMFNTSADGISALNNFMEDEFDKEEIRVIDPEATSDEELQPSYVGKVIINCNVCHSHIFEDKENIHIDEEGYVNTEETCPYCGEQEGFVIIGEIRPYAEETEETPEQEPVANTDEPVEDTEVPAEKIEEALGVGAGLALGGAAIGAGIVGSKLLDDVNEDDSDEELNELLDIEIDAKGFGGSGNNVHVGPGSLPLNASAENNKMSRATRKALVKDQESDDMLQEDFKEVSITTEDQHLEMTSDENGKVTVTTEPVANEPAAEEVISPVSDETVDELVANSEVADEAPLFDETDYEDFDFEDIDEEGLDELGEAYLRNVYENVSSFKTTDAFTNDTHLIIEGVITFDSGVTKKTGFMFEAKDANARGQVRFTGSNKQLTESTNAFSLVGKIDNKKLCVESLKYNYTVNNAPVRGIVRRK